MENNPPPDKTCTKNEKQEHENDSRGSTLIYRVMLGTKNAARQHKAECFTREFGDNIACQTTHWCDLGGGRVKAGWKIGAPCEKPDYGCSLLSNQPQRLNKDETGFKTTTTKIILLQANKHWLRGQASGIIQPTKSNKKTHILDRLEGKERSLERRLRAEGLVLPRAAHPQTATVRPDVQGLGHDSRLGASGAGGRVG